MNRRNGLVACGWLLGCLAVCMAAVARADSITFAGTNIPMACQIEAIRGGGVFYMDGRSQRQRRALEDIATLSFDDLPELDQAERAAAQEDHDATLSVLLSAMLKAEGDLKKLWVGVRLSQLHDLRGEYVQSAGHAAAVFALSDDPYWSRLQPVSPVDEPFPAAAKEALEHLQAAARKIKSVELKAAVDRMLKNVRPVFERLTAQSGSNLPQSGSTISGFDKKQIEAGTLVIPSLGPNRRSEPPMPEPVDQPPVPVSHSAPREFQASTDAGDDSAVAIDAVLKAGQWTAARERCRQVADDPGERDLAHFLRQYGLALAHCGAPRDAAVMFTRSAVLFPDSPDAAECLIETAIIYRDVYRRNDVAHRLLELAEQKAAAMQQDSIVMLARELLGQIKPEEGE